MMTDITIVKENGIQCLVFADHDSDRNISESCYRTWFNGNKVDPGIIWVGYSEIDDVGPADADTFKCNGKRVCFSREIFDEMKKKFPTLSATGKGHVQAIIMTIKDGQIVYDKTYGRSLGSDRIYVINELNSISTSVKTGNFTEKSFSRMAGIIGLSLLMTVSLIITIMLAVALLMTDDPAFIALASIRLIPFLLVIGIGAGTLYQSIKWKECKDTKKIDFDVATILAYIPGFGLVYLHKWIKGIFISGLFTALISIFVMSLIYEYFGEWVDVTMATSLIWALAILFVSCMETEYECFKIGMNRECTAAHSVENYEYLVMMSFPFFPICIELLCGNVSIIGILLSILTVIFPYYGIRRGKTMWPK